MLLNRNKKGYRSLSKTLAFPPWLQLWQKTHILQKKSCNPLSESASVSASLEEKEMRVLAIALALALTLTLFLYSERTKVATS